MLAVPGSPWEIPLLAVPASHPSDRWLARLIEAPLPGVRRELEARDFWFLTAEEIHRREPVLAAAAELIDLVPSLAAIVRQHVRHVTLLRAQDGYDISHSEPRWPDWIFVSVPETSSDVSALRAADNIVHEAMHLQLTQLELVQPLVDDRQTMLWSPWKEEPRDLQGNLHGLYVFRCVGEFLRRLQERDRLTGSAAAWIKQRLSDIEQEVSLLPLGDLASGLTGEGRLFLSSLAGGSMSRAPQNAAASGEQKKNFPTGGEV
jgi:HEXXH motif-containing protein